MKERKKGQSPQTEKRLAWELVQKEKKEKKKLRSFDAINKWSFNLTPGEGGGRALLTFHPERGKRNLSEEEEIQKRG